MGGSESRILYEAGVIVTIFAVVVLLIYGFYVLIFNKKEKTMQDWSDGDTDYNDYEEDSKLTNKTKGQVKKYQ